MANLVRLEKHYLNKEWWAPGPADWMSEAIGKARHQVVFTRTGFWFDVMKAGNQGCFPIAIASRRVSPEL